VMQISSSNFFFNLKNLWMLNLIAHIEIFVLPNSCNQ
jgi:hypothetical protein